MTRKARRKQLLRQDSPGGRAPAQHGPWVTLGALMAGAALGAPAARQRRRHP